MPRPAHECYHCKQWIEEGEAHDCWTTTEAALTAELSADLRDAWERLREAAAELGEQRIYASLHSIMFARNSPLAAKADAVITKLKSEGFIAALHKKWFGAAAPPNSTTVKPAMMPKL